MVPPQYWDLQELRRPTADDAASSARGHQPVLLLLGGGMAAGKSSIRRLIGQDVLWSKVRRMVLGMATQHPCLL